ncbi:MAG: hypothetical protein ACI31S_01370 [Bacilli bacterium]
MKKITMIIILCITIINFIALGAFIAIGTTKVENVERAETGELITIDILGVNVNYYYEF